MEMKNNQSPAGESFRLLTKKEMAAEFGVCYRTIERWHNSGYITCIRIGGRIYFSYAEVVRIRDRFLTGYPIETQIQCAEDIYNRYRNRMSGR